MIRNHNSRFPEGDYRDTTMETMVNISHILGAVLSGPTEMKHPLTHCEFAGQLLAVFTHGLITKTLYGRAGRVRPV